MGRGRQAPIVQVLEHIYFSSNTVSENEIFVDISTHGGAYYRCTGHRTEIRVTGGEVAELRRNR